MVARHSIVTHVHETYMTVSALELHLHITRIPPYFVSLSLRGEILDEACILRRPRWHCYYNLPGVQSAFMTIHVNPILMVFADNPCDIILGRVKGLVFKCVCVSCGDLVKRAWFWVGAVSQ